MKDFIEIFNSLNNSCTIESSGKTIQLFDEPIFGFADAKDELFEEYKKLEAVGPWYLSPNEWLSDAKTVISFFLPFSKEIKSANEKACEMAAVEWTYGRIEGQSFINEFARKIADELQSEGTHCVIPLQDPRFFVIAAGKASNGKEYEGVTEQTFSSAWSERHAAFVAGLGSFGMSRGLITKKGMAGRFGSIIVDKYYEPSKRDYKDIYEYCIKCGACSKRCPVDAIPVDQPKDHTICQPHVEKSKQIFAPRYGCGLCQTRVPCMSERP